MSISDRERSLQCPHCNTQVLASFERCNRCGLSIMTEKNNIYCNNVDDDDERLNLNPTAPSFNPFPFGSTPSTNPNKLTPTSRWACSGCCTSITYTDCAMGDLICKSCRLVLDRSSIGSSTSSDNSPPFGPISHPVFTPPRPVPSNNHSSSIAHHHITESTAPGVSTPFYQSPLHLQSTTALHSPFIPSYAVETNRGTSVGPLQSSLTINAHQSPLVEPHTCISSNTSSGSEDILNQKALAAASALGLPTTAQSVELVKSIYRLQQEAKQRIDKENPTGTTKGDTWALPLTMSSKGLQAGGGISQGSVNLPGQKVSKRASRKHSHLPKSEVPWEAMQGQEPHRNLYVANFDESMTEEQVESLFGEYCEVRRVVMKDVVDRASGDVKGHYCFVWTSGIEEAIRARNALHNAKVNGKKLQVKFAREGSFKITSMSITTDAQGNANRKVVTLRSDVNNITNNSNNSNNNNPISMNNMNPINHMNHMSLTVLDKKEECQSPSSPLNFDSQPFMSFLDD